MRLTENQKRAVHFKHGNALINAGGGSGKTAVITARISNLIANENVKPESILALTFTKEAAQNMRDRLGGIIGKEKASRVEISTFHSFAYRYMNKYFPDYYQNVNMMQNWWKMSKLYDIVSKPSKNNDIGLSLGIRAGDLGSFVSYQKANKIKGGMNILIDEKTSYVDSVSEFDLQKAFDMYCTSVTNARLLDFDDMLVDFYYQLENNLDFRNELKNVFEFIMVDEFQDTNTINLDILKLISENNLFAVGDFRQGIYGFINANIDNILDFENIFESVTKIELSDNFRSTKNIVSFINEIIDKSPNEKYKRFDKQLAARSDVGEKIKLKVYNSEANEIKGVISKIEDLLDSGKIKDVNDIAIITRTNAHIGMIESMMAEAKLPVDVSNTRSFFDRREIADMLSYAKHALDDKDDMSIKRIINSPSRYISKSLIGSIESSAYENNTTFEKACSSFDSWGLNSLLSTFRHLRKNTNVNAGKFLREISRNVRYEEHINKIATSSSEANNRISALNRLFELAYSFSNIEKFLTHVSIIQSNNSKQKDGIKILTAHAAKGLEYKYVFVVSCTSENFPHSMSQDAEEERRLFYVACSRAKDFLEVSYPIYGSSLTEGVKEVSPFLEDVAELEMARLRKECLYGGVCESETSIAI